MAPVAIITVSDNKPVHFYLNTPKGKLHIDLFRRGTGRKLSIIFKRLEAVKELLSWNLNGPLITPDFGSILRSLELIELQDCQNIYDVGLGPIKAASTEEEDALRCENMSDALSKIENFPPYQSILAKAQNAYYGMENVGLMLNYAKVQPCWSLSTFSGRSKSTGFNVQGWSETDVVYNPGVPCGCTLICFDWICADLRAASLLSNDDNLIQSFVTADPYSYLSRLINNDDSLRENCKILLLKTINNLEFDDEVISVFYPKLCEWLKNTEEKATRLGVSHNIVGRQFRINSDRNVRSLINATLQGSVASAMQSVVSRVHQLFPNYLVCDIHDGLVLSVPSDSKIIKNTIDCVGEIFSRPFKDILPYDCFFPYKVFIGKEWKKWQKIKTVQLAN